MNRSFFRGATSLVLLALAIAVPALSHSVRKAPYLIFGGNAATMEILWQLSGTRIDTVRWGTDGHYGSGWAVSTEFGDDHQHRFVFSGLKPSTRYYYQVAAGDTVYAGSFRSAPGLSADSVKFFIYGDVRSNPDKHDQVAGAMVRAFSADSTLQTMVLVNGDLVLNGDDEGLWQSEFFNPEYRNVQKLLASIPYQSCRGNHEKQAVLFRKYFPYPAVSSTYWSFDYGPAHCISLDEYVPFDTGSAQYRWLENDLKTTRQPWKFIYLHEPGWTAGRHKNSDDVQKYIEPLCEKYDVPVVLAGHNHNYARADVHAPGGKVIHHLTVGGGGAPLYDVDLSWPNVVTGVKTLCYATISIRNANEMEFRAYTENDKLIDQFVVKRGGK